MARFLPWRKAGSPPAGQSAAEPLVPGSQAWGAAAQDPDWAGPASEFEGATGPEGGGATGDSDGTSLTRPDGAPDAAANAEGAVAAAEATGSDESVPGASSDQAPADSPAEPAPTKPAKPRRRSLRPRVAGQPSADAPTAPAAVGAAAMAAATVGAAGAEATAEATPDPMAEPNGVGGFDASPGQAPTAAPGRSAKKAKRPRDRSPRPRRDLTWLFALVGSLVLIGLGAMLGYALGTQADILTFNEAVAEADAISQLNASPTPVPTVIGPSGGPSATITVTPYPSASGASGGPGATGTPSAPTPSPTGVSPSPSAGLSGPPQPTPTLVTPTPIAPPAKTTASKSPSGTAKSSKPPAD